MELLFLLMALTAGSLGTPVTNMSALMTTSVSTVSGIVETNIAAIYAVASVPRLLPGIKALPFKEDLKRRDLPTSFVTITRHVEYANVTPTRLPPSTSTLVVTITSKVTATLLDYRAQLYVNQRPAVPQQLRVATKAVRRDVGSGQDIQPSTTTVMFTVTSQVTVTTKIPDYRAQLHTNQHPAVPMQIPVATKAVRRDQGSGQDIPAAEIVPPVAGSNTSSTSGTASSTTTNASSGVPYFPYSGIPNPTPTSGGGDGLLEGVSVSGVVALALAVAVAL